MIQVTSAAALGNDVRQPPFPQRLHAAARAQDSWLCVGLDPETAQLPAGIGLDEFLHGIVEATADLVCCFKPQIAFYEALGLDGLGSLRKLIRDVQQHTLVLVDAK